MVAMITATKHHFEPADQLIDMIPETCKAQLLKGEEDSELIIFSPYSSKHLIKVEYFSPTLIGDVS